MTALTELFNPTFFMFLGILLLVVAIIVVYFESKAREQNHKIASMLSLVSTLAEDMNRVKVGINRFALQQHQHQEPLNNAFISDDYYESEEENKLIEVSDDESEESDSDDEEEQEENNVKVLKLNIHSDEEQEEDLEEEEGLEEELELEATEDLEDFDDIDEKSDEYVNENPFSATDLKTINIHLDESLDYKKLPLPKLRTIVSEKGLATDTTKLKKNELLKLLEIE